MQTAHLADNSLPRQKPQRKVADLLIKYLEQLEIDFVFGIPGGAIEPLYNALAYSASHGGIRPIVARHETGAAFMADGYFRQTGKLGVCCATTGPGTTNLVTGVASAYENGIPMLVITAQTALSFFGKGAFQESSCTGINTVAIFDQCTRISTLVSHVNQFEHKLVNAIMTAFRSPAGPAHLSVPWDIFGSAVATIEPKYHLPSLLRVGSSLDSSGVDDLYKELLSAKKTVFVIGAGCGEAIDKIEELAVLTEAKIVATPHGKGFINPYHFSFRGIIGFAGHSSARLTLTDSDVDTVVAIGSNFSEWASNAWDDAALLNHRLIHVDSNEEHFTRSPMAKLQVRGNISSVFTEVIARLKAHRYCSLPEIVPGHPNQSSTEPADYAQDSKALSLGFQFEEDSKFYSAATPIKPQSLMRELAEFFPPNTCFLADTGNSQAWSVHYLHPRGLGAGSSRTSLSAKYQSSFEFASMGWAIGAAIGTALGKPDHPVVCLTGDGSLLMSGQEITVAVQEKLPVIFIVLNDSALGMVRHGQRLARSAEIATELPRIDYCAFAKALGADAYVINAPGDFKNLSCEALCRRPGPTVLDVRVDPDEVPPMDIRIRVLRNQP